MIGCAGGLLWAYRGLVFFRLKQSVAHSASCTLPVGRLSGWIEAG